MKFWIFELVWVPNFSLNRQFCVFWPHLPKKGTTEQNNQSNKLQGFAFCIGNVNSMIDFEHFGDLKNLIILNILKEKLVNSCLLDLFHLNHIQEIWLTLASWARFTLTIFRMEGWEPPTSFSDIILQM